jgi:hypothetical protein
VARPARIPLVGISSIQQRCATIADLRVWCCTRPDSNSIHYRTVSGFTRHCHTLGDAGAIQVIVSSRFGVERIGVVIWGGRTAIHMAIHAAATPRLSVRMLPSVIGSPGGCLGAILLWPRSVHAYSRTRSGANARSTAAVSLAITIRSTRADPSGFLRSHVTFWLMPEIAVGVFHELPSAQE